MEDNVVCVIATEKHTGLIKTCTSCERDGFNKPLDRILDMKIKYITTQDSTIVIEAAK